MIGDKWRAWQEKMAGTVRAKLHPSERPVPAPPRPFKGRPWGQLTSDERAQLIEWERTRDAVRRENRQGFAKRQKGAQREEDRQHREKLSELRERVRALDAEKLRLEREEERLAALSRVQAEKAQLDDELAMEDYVFGRMKG